MTTRQLGVICLIKSAITGQKLPLPEDFNWDEVSAFLITNGLSAMGFTGALNCGIPETNSRMMLMQDQYCIEFLHSERQLEQLDLFYRAMEEKGIEYMPVKGAVMKGMYPTHEMRNMGDADILIHEEQKEQIAEIVTGLGYEFRSESDHEWNWIRPELKLELHKRLVSSDEKTYYGYFGDGWKWAKHQEGCRFTMSQEDAFIFEFSHFTRHYCKGGIGVRHMIDLWVHLYKADNMDMAYIRKQMDEICLGKFYENVLQTLNAWFYDGPTNDCTDYITEFLFGGGKVSHDVKIAENAAAKTASQGKFKVLLRRVFPAKKHLVWNYPQYQKLPLPIAWVARWCSLMKNRDVVKTRVEDMKDATDEKVAAYRESLEFVGLEVLD